MASDTDSNIELDFEVGASPDHEDHRTCLADDQQASGDDNGASTIAAGEIVDSLSLSLEALVGLDDRDPAFNLPTDVVIEDWASFYRETTRSCLGISCCQQGILFHYVWKFLEQNKRSFALWHVPAQRFARQFTFERFKRDAARIYEAAQAAGVRLPTANRRAAIALICNHLDIHMRDVDLTQNEIHNIVNRSPSLKRLRNSINADVPDPHRLGSAQLPRSTSGFESYLPEHRGRKPKDHRKPKSRPHGQHRER